MMDSLAQIDISDAIDQLKQYGLRITRNREKLLRVLISSDHPLSADELRRKAGFTSTDLATVYRNLEAFQSAGILQRIPLEDGSQLFELTNLDDHYHHLICRQCHRAERLEVCLGGELSNKAEGMGYTKIAHVLEVYGLCGPCTTASG